MFIIERHFIVYVNHEELKDDITGFVEILGDRNVHFDIHGTKYLLIDERSHP